VPGLPSDATRLLAAGHQSVAKERQGAAAANRVLVQVAVLRLPSHGTDLLVSLNSGAVISAASSAAGAAGEGRQRAAEGAPALLAAMLKTLLIRDYGLFGHTE